MLIVHGAFARWAESSNRYAAVSIFTDGLLMAIALITIEQLQGLSLPDILKIGVFFAAFGISGRQLMHSLLARHPASARR
jgi:hypothetical protein